MERQIQYRSDRRWPCDSRTNLDTVATVVPAARAVATVAAEVMEVEQTRWAEVTPSTTRWAEALMEVWTGSEGSPSSGSEGSLRGFLRACTLLHIASPVVEMVEPLTAPTRSARHSR